MNEQPKAAGFTGENPPINERLWQKWLWKNRELDKLGARRRVRFLEVVLAIVVAASVFQSFAR